MATATPIPEYIYAGDSFDWELSLPDYLPSDGWSATLALSPEEGSATPLIVGVADGDVWTFSATGAGTSSYDLGGYRWAVKVSKGSDLITAATGRIKVFSDSYTTPAQITQLQTDIAAVDAAIRAAVTDKEGVLKYSFSTTVGTREVEFRRLPELHAHRAWLKRQLDQTKGHLGYGRQGGWKQIGVKFQ
jgi:hypothetical protein